MAATRGFEVVVTVLLGAEADIDARDDDGQAPLDMAIRCECEAVVEVLRAAGATNRGTGQAAVAACYQSVGSSSVSSASTSRHRRGRRVRASSITMRSCRPWISAL